MCSFSWICANFSECQILWSLCSVDFHTFTLKLPIQTLHSAVPELQVFASSLENCQNFSKMSTPMVTSALGFKVRVEPIANVLRHVRCNTKNDIQVFLQFKTNGNSICLIGLISSISSNGSIFLIWPIILSYRNCRKSWLMFFLVSTNLETCQWPLVVSCVVVCACACANILLSVSFFTSRLITCEFLSRPTTKGRWLENERAAVHSMTCWVTLPLRKKYTFFC